MARRAPIFGSISCNGRCMICTSADRNTKPITIAIRRVIAIFTIVHRRSSRCSRNGLEVSLSGNSRNLKRLRKAMTNNAELRLPTTERQMRRGGWDSIKSQAPSFKTQTNLKKGNSKFQEGRPISIATFTRSSEARAPPSAQKGQAYSRRGSRCCPIPSCRRTSPS